MDFFPADLNVKNLGTKVIVGVGDLNRHVFNQLDRTKIETIVFYGDAWATEDCSRLFENMKNLVRIEGMENFDTSRATNMSQMFSGCTNLSSLDMSYFITSEATDMSKMFSGCNMLPSLNCSTFDVSKVENMSEMFAGCWRLSSLNLSDWDTQSVTDMSGMFQRCRNLASLDLSSFVAAQANLSKMFENCPAGEIWKPILEAGGLKAAREAMKTQEPENPAIAAAMKAVADIAPKQSAPVQAR